MHIVHVVESFAAGTYGIVQAVCNRQAADGHRVTLCHSLRAETPADWRQQFDAGVDSIHLPMRRALSPLSDLRALLQLWRELRRLRPDIVHLHSSKAGALGRLLSLVLRSPRWFFSPHGLSFLQSADTDRVHRPFLFLERVLALMPVRFIACSASEAELIRRYLKVSAEVVNNGIDVEAVPNKAGDGTPLTVGSAGRLSLARNPRLFARIAANPALAGLSFRWIGGGEADDVQALQAAGVEVSGWLPRGQALSALSRLDIYVQTSLWEGMPVAVLEAMAAGLPAVVSDVVGNRDLVADGVNGFVAGQEHEFVQRIAELARDAQLRRRMGESGREAARTRYSVEAMMRSLYRVYAS